MEVRLVQLLASFITVSSDYMLARLEFALHFPERRPPPIIERLPDASEETFRLHWPCAERQLEEALIFVKQIEAARGTQVTRDAAFRFVRRTVRELDQYARAVRWVSVVTDRERD